MKQLILAATILVGFQEIALAQTKPVEVNTVIEAEHALGKQVERMGM